MEIAPTCTTAAFYHAVRLPVFPVELKPCTMLLTGHLSVWHRGKPGPAYTPRWTKDAWTDVTIDPPEVLASKEQLRTDPNQIRLRKALLTYPF